MSTPWAAPEGPAVRPAFADYEGDLLMITPLSTTTAAVMDKDVPVTIARLVVLDGPAAGMVIERAEVAPRVLRSALAPHLRARRPVLGRLGRGEARTPGFEPWQLFPATPEDTVIAREWWAENMTADPAAE